MSITKQIEPQNWSSFLEDFSARNNGRRARFELFHHAGAIKEEEQEAHFDSASIEGRTVAVKRTDTSGHDPKELTIHLPDIHGISVQLDTDESEDTLEFTNHKGDMTVLHFESKVDGDS